MPESAETRYAERQQRYLRLRDEQRRKAAIELQPTEVAAIEEAAAQREPVEARPPEVDRGEGGAMQRDDAFVVGLPTFAVRLGHCAPG